MQEYYKILNLTESATDEEIEVAYKTLKEKYSKERFLEGEQGNMAAKNLTKLESAYKEIVESRKVSDDTDSYSEEDFSKVERLIKDGALNDAQHELDAFTVRSAEWHYMQSVIFYKKNWNNESKKQLEIAMKMDSKNQKYTDAYKKLVTKINDSQRIFNSGNADPNYESSRSSRQMGGSSNECMSLCTTICCMDMLCSLCCRL